MMMRRSLFTLMMVLVVELAMAGSPPGKYVPKGMHDYTYYTLDNGAGVILHEDHSVPTVTFRVVVNMGSWYFDSNYREIPHILEHMLFMGTSQHSETELEDRVQFNGGSWNAQTNAYDTDYHIAIHADRLKTGIDIMYEMFTDSTLSKDHFDNTISVIEREQGQEVSAFRRWLYDNDIIYNAKDRLTKIYFEGVDDTGPPVIYSDIHHDDVLQAFKDYYVPENYLIVVSGDFSQRDIKRYIQDTFGTIEPKPSKAHIKTSFVIPEDMIISESRLDPLIGIDSTIEFYYPTVMAHEKEQVALLDIVEDYLEDVLFKKLRVENALAYTPSIVNYMGHEGRGFFYIDFDAHVDHYEDVVAIYDPILQRIAKGEQDILDELEKYRMKYLLKVSQYDYTSSEIGEWYASYSHEIKRDSEFYYDSYWIEQADVKKIPALVKRIFLDQNFYIAKSEPALYTSTAYIIVAVVILLVILMVIYFIRHHSLKLIRKG